MKDTDGSMTANAARMSSKECFRCCFPNHVADECSEWKNLKCMECEPLYAAGYKTGARYCPTRAQSESGQSPQRNSKPYSRGRSRSPVRYSNGNNQPTRNNNNRFSPRGAVLPAPQATLLVPLAQWP